MQYQIVNAILKNQKDIIKHIDKNAEIAFCSEITELRKTLSESDARYSELEHVLKQSICEKASLLDLLETKKLEICKL